MNIVKAGLVTAVIVAIASLVAPAAHAAGQTHYLAVHVDEGEPGKMNLALNNVENVYHYYESIGDTAVIEVVAYGPGLKMYMADSPVKARIETMALELDGVQFSACGNTHRKMSAKAGKQIELLSEAKMVSAGVVRLMELQEQGYSYLRP